MNKYIDTKLHLSRIWADQPKKQISILLPTRGRTELLKKSLSSLLSVAKDPKSIELLVGFDDDDKQSSSWFRSNVAPELNDLGVSVVVVEFKRLGYEKLNEYLNILAGLAEGRWLFFWNDDAVMETEHWDSHITAHNDRFVVQRMKTHNEHPYAIFPVVPRDWYYLLGHLSEHQLNDAAISQTAYILGIMQTIEVYVTHDRADLTGNNADETYHQRKIFEGNHLDPRDFNYEPTRQRRMVDANKIAWYLDRIGQPSEWFRSVMLGKQDPWAIMLSKENDPNKQVTIYE